MSPEPRSEANRRNAQKSTGPRSTAGKARSAKNALRHGLNRPVQDARCLARIVEIADALRSDDPKLSRHEAIEIAEAVVRCEQIQEARDSAIARALEDLSVRLTHDLPREQLEELARFKALPELLSLQRYEERAASRLGKRLRRYPWR